MSVAKEAGADRVAQAGADKIPEETEPNLNEAVRYAVNCLCCPVET